MHNQQPDGRRVQKVSGGTTTNYVYDAQGELAAEYSSAAAQASACGTCYLTADTLGSTRMITDETAMPRECHDYLPFGEEIGRTAGCYAAQTTNTLKFTGKERDGETGNDYFGARYFSSVQERWTIPDWSARGEPVPYAKLDDPQSLNLYGYGRNSPLVLVDTDGHELVIAQELKDTVAQIRQESPSFNAELAAHEGTGPNLTIRFGATPDDPGGGATSGNTHTDVSNLGPEAMEAPFQVWDDGVKYGGYKGATVTINSSIRKDSGQVEQVTEHEVGHVRDARTNTNTYGKQSQYTKQTHGKVPHNDRPEERTANQFKDSVNGERAAYKREQQRVRKLERSKNRKDRYE